MTQEEKDLSLKDLCSRLPYGVIGEYKWKRNNSYDRELTGSLYDELKSSWNSSCDSSFIPYLRPMSSMTDEEHTIINNLLDCLNPKNELWIIIEFLDKHMLDQRGLIEKGLALEAPEGMYNIEN